MSVRQLGPARRAAPPGAARPEAAKQRTRIDRFEEERHVARLLEEYAEKWKALEGYGGYWEESFGMLRPTLGGVLRVSPEGVSLTYFDQRNERWDIRIIPPGYEPIAEKLVEFERRYKFISKLKEEIWTEPFVLHLAILEILRRYAPLLGKDYNIPELKLNTGDPYRDFLETLYAARVYSAVESRADEDAVAVYGRGQGGRTRVAVEVPVEPPATISYGPGWSRRINDVKAELAHIQGGVAPFIDFYEISTAPPFYRKTAILIHSPRHDEKTDSLYLSVLNAALLLHLERAGGVLTKLTEAAEKRREALEPFTGEALVAAEAAHLLFA